MDRESPWAAAVSQKEGFPRGPAVASLVRTSKCSGKVHEMKGSIRRRAAGIWQVRIEVGTDPVSGRRLRRSVHVYGTLKDAERERTALLHSLQAGTYVDPARETVAEFFERWLRDYAQASVGRRTYERYEEIVRLHVIPTLGRLRLSDLRPAHILTAEREWREGGLSASTVLKHHRLVREALQHAVRWQLMVVNPADAVTAPRPERREMLVLDRDQAAALLECAAGNEFEVALLTALYTGLRVGELLGLRWRDLDLLNGQLRVQQAVQPVKGGGVAYGPPKTHRSRRAVSLPSPVSEALQRQRAAQTKSRLAIGPDWQENDLVFTDAFGRPMSRTRLRLAFRRLLAEAGLPTLRLHDLRHTMATLMLAQGEHPKIVSERLGHATVGITLDTYSHVLPGLQAAAAERLAVALGGATGRGRPLETDKVDHN
jgi:integrase